MNVFILVWIGFKLRTDEVYCACWGECDQSLEWSESTFLSPFCNHSALGPLTEKTAPCLLHFKSYQGLMFSVTMTDFHQLEKNEGKRNVALCCCSAGTPKIIPTTTAASHWQHSNTAHIIHSQVISREHRAELEFRCGIADINNNYTHSRRFRRNVSHLHVLLCLDNSLASSHFLCAHRSR